MEEKHPVSSIDTLAGKIVGIIPLGLLSGKESLIKAKQGVEVVASRSI